MCQCVLFDCCWTNCCGQFCAGWQLAYCLCSAWCFKTADMLPFDSECCHFMAFDGWGTNCFCCGSICFASEAVKQWSDMRNMNRKANDQYVVIHEENPGAAVATNTIINQIDPDA